MNRPDLRIASSLQSLDLKRGVFIKQLLCEDTEIEWQPYWRTSQPFCLLSQAPERISIHVTLLSTTWCFVTGFAVVFGTTLYSAHADLNLDVDLDYVQLLA